MAAYGGPKNIFFFKFNNSVGGMNVVQNVDEKCSAIVVMARVWVWSLWA